MFNKIICSCLVLMFVVPAFAEEQDEIKSGELQIVPLAQFENLSLTSQSVQSVSGGLVIANNDLQFVAMYSKSSFKEPLQYGFSSVNYSFDALLDGSIGRHQYIALLTSESDQPFNSDLNNFKAGAAYGYEIISNPQMSLVLGGGFVLGDFGVETPNGESLPLLPVPFVRINYRSIWLDTRFEFLTSPNLNLTLAPEGRVRLTGDFRLNQIRDSRDIIFESALEYRLFSKKHRLGDFAALSFGIKNDNFSAFNPEMTGETESAEVQYYALFGAIDLSLVKISSGYAFGGQTRYGEDQIQDSGQGFYLSAQGMFAF